MALMHLQYILSTEMGVFDGSLLCEVQGQEGDAGHTGHHDEEQEAGNPGDVSYLSYEDVQNREDLVGPFRKARENCG